MLEAERQSESREQSLKALLSEAALREKRSRKRAVLYTVVPVLMGLLFLAASLYRVRQLTQSATKLDEEITSLNGQIEFKTQEVQQKKEELESLDNKVQEARKALEGPGNPQQKAKKALNVLAEVPPRNEKPAVTPTPAISQSSSKFDGSTYTGSDKTTITVEVLTQGTEVRLYYTLDSKPGGHNIDGKSEKRYSFTFTLDKTKHNPSNLLMNFDFYGEKGEMGKCQVKITDNKGVTNTYSILQRSAGSALHSFRFNIV
jgi:hypothetical protein